MKKKIAIYFGLLVILLLLAAGWIVHFHTDFVTAHIPQTSFGDKVIKILGQQAAADTGDDEPDTTQNEIPVKSGHVSIFTFHRYVDGFGVIAPRPVRGDQPAGSAAIAAPIAGIVSQVLCQTGQAVHRGDALIQLDDTLAKAAEDQAAAALAQENAVMENLKAQPRPGALRVAELSLQKSQQAADFAQKNYDRLKGLEGTSTKSIEQAASDLSAAQNDLAVNQQQLQLLKAGPTPQDMAQEIAKVAQAQSALAAAQAQHRALKIVSPIDAVVVNVNVNPGEAADPTKVLVDLVASDRLMVDVDVPAAQFALLALGQASEISPTGGLVASSAASQPTLPVQGKIAAISPAVDRKSGGIQISIDLPADAHLPPGMEVSVRIIVETHTDKFAVPRESAVTDINGDTAIATLDGDQATHKMVKIGLEENGLIEIDADGIKEGDTVVVAGAYGLPQATKVKIQN